MVLSEKLNEFNAHFQSWLRIEPRCRQDNFAQGIQARTADPLWMLARQWQMGEFRGEDAGSPINVELSYSTQSIDAVKLGGHDSAMFSKNVPLEAVVEQEDNDVDFRERVRIGQEFERRLRTACANAGNADDVDQVIEALRVDESVGFPMATEVQLYEIDRATQRFVRFMKGRVIDGLAVLQGIIFMPGTGTVTQADVNNVRDDIVKWLDTVCRRPGTKRSPAWQAEKLDYRFEANNYQTSSDTNTPSLETHKTKLVAPDYRNGDVDWYTFSSSTSTVRGPWMKPSDPKLNPVVATPTRIEVMGTSPRWWAFEDGNTDFGAMDVAKPDLAKLLLMEFVLVHGDDWFSIPAPVSIGNLVRVDELKVWNVFGEQTTIDPARRVYRENTNWYQLEHESDRPLDVLLNQERFDLFTLSGVTSQKPGLDTRVMISLMQQQFEPGENVIAGLVLRAAGTPKYKKQKKGVDKKFNTTTVGNVAFEAHQYFLSPPRPVLFIPPVAGFRQESAPLDEVRFLRDEGANMVWGIEHIVANQMGRAVSGFDAQRERYERWRETLTHLQPKLSMYLEHGSPSEDEKSLLERVLRDLEDQIAALSPYANPTPSQNKVPQYRLASTVPDNWVPFIPVRRKTSDLVKQTDLQFRRAKMLRSTDHSKMEGNPTITLQQFLKLHRALKDNPSMAVSDLVSFFKSYLSDTKPSTINESIPSMSRLLALDEDAILYINEEAVPRAGLRVQQTMQRVRWIDGTTHVWLGKKVLTGRGEGSSGLRFDMLTTTSTEG